LASIDLLGQDRWNGDCPLCRFFRDMAGPGASSAILKTAWPDLIDSENRRESAFFKTLPDGQDTPAPPAVTYMADGDGLAGYNRGYLGRASGRIVPPMCDFTVVRNWLSLCTVNHDEA
jgi:hypothetical protein